MKKMILTIILIIGIIMTASVLGYERSDFIELIENTDNCLTECYAIVNITNPLNRPLNISPEKLELWSIKSDIDIPNLLELKLERWKNISFTKETENITKAIASYNCNGTNEYWNFTVLPQHAWCYSTINGTTNLIFDNDYILNIGDTIYWKEEYWDGSYKNITEYYMGWKEFDPIGKVIQPNKTYTIKISGKKQPLLGKNNIDWKIRLDTEGEGIYEPDWAWWNSSLNYSCAIDIQNINSSARTYEPIVLPYGELVKTCGNFSGGHDVDTIHILQNGLAELPVEIHNMTDGTFQSGDYIVFLLNSSASSTEHIEIYFGGTGVNDGYSDCSIWTPCTVYNNSRWIFAMVDTGEVTHIGTQPADNDLVTAHGWVNHADANLRYDTDNSKSGNVSLKANNALMWSDYHFSPSKKIYADVDFWFWDDSSDSDMLFIAYADDGGNVCYIGTHQGISKTHYFAGLSTYTTNQPRSTGWHHFRYHIIPNGGTSWLEIDGIRTHNETTTTCTDFNDFELRDGYSGAHSVLGYADDIFISNQTFNTYNPNVNWTVLNETINATGEAPADPCEPTINEDWELDDNLTCTDKLINLGTGNLKIVIGTSLKLVNSNITLAGINVSNADSGLPLLNISWATNDYFMNITG